MSVGGGNVGGSGGNVGRSGNVGGSDGGCGIEVMILVVLLG